MKHAQNDRIKLRTGRLRALVRLVVGVQQPHLRRQEVDLDRLGELTVDAVRV